MFGTEEGSRHGVQSRGDLRRSSPRTAGCCNPVRRLIMTTTRLVSAVGMLVTCAGCAGGPSLDEPFDMSVKISTAKHPDDPVNGTCAFQVTDLRFAQMRADNLEIQDRHGAILGQAGIGMPSSEGPYCTFTTVVPNIPPATAYQVMVPLYGIAPGAPMEEARDEYTVDEARIGVRLIVTGRA